MSKTSDLLIEVGTEELPPKSLAKLAGAFAKGIEQGLVKQQLKMQAVNWYASPRRLAIIIDQLELAQADQTIQKRGPAIKAAYDEAGKPTKAGRERNYHRRRPHLRIWGPILGYVTRRN